MHGMSNVKIMTTCFLKCNSGGVDLATKHNTGQQVFTKVMFPR